MKISIIVPVYNAEKTIEECINSILNQSYNDIEIILINDGSKDDSEKIIKDKFTQNEKVIYVYQENAGVSSARNHGIEIAKGDYIFFVDSDDILDKDVLLDLVKNLKKDNLVGILHKVKTPNKESITYYSKEKYTKEEFIYNILLGNVMGVIWGYLFDTAVIKNMLFDVNTNYLEDTIFLLQYLLNISIEQVAFINNGNYYNYVINEMGITCSRNNILEKCKKITYSLNKISDITNHQYDEILNNRKIELLEKELRLVEQKNIYGIIIENIKIEKYTGKSLRVKIFSYLYKNEKSVMLYNYYKIREKAKQVIKNKI